MGGFEIGVRICEEGGYLEEEIALSEVRRGREDMTKKNKMKGWYFLECEN